jgi:nucleoside-diphosphate-sugar epimerase
LSKNSSRTGRILVTGGAGFVGSHIVEVCLEQGMDVIILDDFSTGRPENLREIGPAPRLTVMPGSVTDIETLRYSIKDVDVVIHGAGVMSPHQRVAYSDVTNLVNMQGTLNVLKASIDAKVERFILASSSSVYGVQSKLPIGPDAPTLPLSPIGASKLAVEKECMNAFRATGLEVVILRYFNTYGPRSLMGAHGNVVNQFFEKIVRLEPPVIYGSGKTGKDFVYVKDVARANLLAATAPSGKNVAGRIYNVGTGVRTTLDELAAMMEEMLFGKNVVLPSDHRSALKGDVGDSQADVANSKTDLGFEARYSLEAGLTEYLRGMLGELPLKWRGELPAMATNTVTALRGRVPDFY